jgi:hypothetical protein
MTLDLSDRFSQFVRGTQRIVIVLKRRTGDVEVATDYGLKRAINRNDVSILGAALTSDATAWNFPTTGFGDDEPKIGDEIREGTTKWRIESVMKRGLNASYRCACNRVRGT